MVHQVPRSAAMDGSRKRADLRLHGLPAFHPAVYQSPSSSSNSSPSRSRGQDGRPNMSPRLRNDTQQQLRHMQRELIANLSRNSPASGPASAQDTPKAPHLAPVLSPGPATPLNLHDGPNDYLSAGSAGGLSPGKVEEIIRKAREGAPCLSSGHGSPAVSPAGGRG